MTGTQPSPVALPPAPQADDHHTRAMEAGRSFASRYRRTMAVLAKRD